MVVADINFVCDDSWMFDLLSKRGSAIKNMDFSEVKVINKQIIDSISEKKDLLTKPVSAFVTLENEATI